MTQREMVTFWVEKSQDELKSANIMYNAGMYLYAGFMCHQAIEKILKAYYIHVKDERHPQIHNLKELMQQTDIYNAANDKQKETITRLNPLYIKARYEDYKKKTSELLTKSYCGPLLAETGELHKWIAELIKQ